MAPTPTLLHQMIEQNDAKHEAGHKRLRHDLMEGLDDVNTYLERLEGVQKVDHEMLMKQVLAGERRKELSASNAVILAAAVSGGFRLLEIVLTQVVQLLK